MVELVGGGSVLTGPTPSSLLKVIALMLVVVVMLFMVVALKNIR